MCGIAAIAGQGWQQAQLEAMVRAQHHRGPDRTGLHFSPSGVAGLGHNRLSIIDLSAGRRAADVHARRAAVAVLQRRDLQLPRAARRAGRLPVPQSIRHRSHPGGLQNGGDRPASIASSACSRFSIWDEQEQSLFAARDRFGVKPLYYSVVDGSGCWSPARSRRCTPPGWSRSRTRRRGPRIWRWATSMTRTGPSGRACNRCLRATRFTWRHGGPEDLAVVRPRRRPSARRSTTARRPRSRTSTWRCSTTASGCASGPTCRSAST